jgi:O-acetyl-ADP-ribose deacetylase (regulator of RNase III)
MPAHARYRINDHASFELVQGNIVEERTDAIVNAANSSLLGGGGVDGAIHRAAGPQLLTACRRVRDLRGPLPPGQAVTTSGGDLQARYVIHTVGPVWQGGKKNEPQILESCYCHCMEEAGRLRCSSISFPSISTGAFGYPVEEAAAIAVRTVVEHLHAPHSVVLARFVLFDPVTFSAYAEAAQKLGSAFPHIQVKAEAIP